MTKQNKKGKNDKNICDFGDNYISSMSDEEFKKLATKTLKIEDTKKQKK